LDVTEPAGKASEHRVLLVEDQMIVAIEVEDMLREFGCIVVGPVGTLKRALRLAQKERLDAAILDVSVDGETIFPVAEELQKRHVPFLFATGYAEHTLPEKWQGLPRLGKPFKRDQLKKLMGSFFAADAEISSPRSRQ
jgi:chemotaxis family two-component system sensor kinase Cph1